MTEDKVFVLMSELLKRTDVAPSDAPAVLDKMLCVYEKHTSRAKTLASITPTQPPIKGKNPLGWPAGVSKREFFDWKRSKLKTPNYSGSLNPHHYKYLRDNQLLNSKPRVRSTELVAAR